MLLSVLYIGPTLFFTRWAKLVSGVFAKHSFMNDARDRHKNEVNIMTERERMQQGRIYNDFDEDLFKRRVKAKKLFKAYNKTGDEETELRLDLMHQLFKKVGNNVWIEPDFKCEFGKNITIEDDVYINFGCVILDCAEVTIGSHSLLGPNIGLYAANHSIDARERINGGCSGETHPYR